MPGEQPTEKQAEFLGKVKSAGGIAACVHSPEEAMRALGLLPKK
jgi:hypothetical protein